MTELAVLVPVLNRPQNVAPLVESFLAGCSADTTMTFLVDVDDDEEWDAVDKFTGDNRVDAYACGLQQETWPGKINLGVQLVEAEWYLCAADDVRFTPGWWEATKELRDDESIGVIGTNDSRSGTGNPRVAAGEHTCHPLLRASYIHDRGTVDVAGEAVHPGYHHWCVDDELVWTAKLRHAWAFCPDAVIEHLHPYWNDGKGWDATYAQGEANAEADMMLWRYRAVRLLGLSFQ